MTPKEQMQPKEHLQNHQKIQQIFNKTSKPVKRKQYGVETNLRAKR